MAPNFDGKPPVIPPGSLILVTGANGFVGSHVVDELIRTGYRVRGTSRDVKKTDWMKELFAKTYGEGKFEAVMVKDMAAQGAFNAACEGVSGIVHVASVTTFDPDPNKVVPTAIAGAVNAAKAAAKYPSIKRFVYTSSSTVITGAKLKDKSRPGMDDWNTDDVEEAWKPPPYTSERAHAVYCASKVRAEQEMWKGYREAKPGFVLNTVLPYANIGEVLSDKQSASTGDWIRELYKGNIDAVKDLPAPRMVNVRDTARIHVAALIDPEVENERIMAFAFPCDWNAILACLRELFPEKTFPKDFKDAPKDLSDLDNSRGAHLLTEFGRPGWTSIMESVRDNTKGL